jgi:serine/threonine-protein kinase
MAKTVLFGRYRLLEPAGSGGSAEVWRARDTKTGEVVAVKRLHPIVFADEAGRRRLKREFEALRLLDERHVVRVRDLRIGRDDAALILDYVPGQSLANRLVAGSPLTTAEAIEVATDVGAALSAAHAAGIVHRDVTPGNILLDPADGARLTDFGIALGGGTETSVTATGQLMGTLRYLAPEQLRGEPATAASDLHSLAAVTYEMLAGRPAYAAATPVALAEAQGSGPDPIAGVPAALDGAVRRAMATDPADRPDDVATFVEQLAAAFADAKTEVITGLAAAGLTGAGAANAEEADDASHAPAWQTDLGPMWRPSPKPVAAYAEASPDAPPAAGDMPRRRLAAPVAAILALVVAGIVLAALTPAERPTDSLAAPASAAPAASQTPSPAAEKPTTKPNADHKGKGRGGKKGSGG